jgi:hypothetical protein
MPADAPLSIGNVRHSLTHELGGHIASHMAGEHSPLGILGVNYEGIAYFNSCLAAAVL